MVDSGEIEAGLSTGSSLSFDCGELNRQDGTLSL